MDSAVNVSVHVNQTWCCSHCRTACHCCEECCSFPSGAQLKNNTLEPTAVLLQVMLQIHADAVHSLYSLSHLCMKTTVMMGTSAKHWAHSSAGAWRRWDELFHRCESQHSQKRTRYSKQVNESPKILERCQFTSVSLYTSPRHLSHKIMEALMLEKTSKVM